MADASRPRLEAIGKALLEGTGKLLKAFVLFLLLLVGYCTYELATAESRAGALCAQVVPGMTAGQLDAFARQNGVRIAQADPSRAIFAVPRSFGRWTCDIRMEAGVVRSASVNFFD